MTLKQTSFKLDLLISHGFLFQVFNATDNLKAIRATHSFLGLTKNFTELKLYFPMFPFDPPENIRKPKVF